MRLALLLCLLASPALADEILVVSPVYSQLVAVPVPSEFRPGAETDRDGSYRLDMVPQGQTAASWKQLITLTGLRGGAAAGSAIDAATELARRYDAACPASFSARSLPLPKIKGAQEVFAGFLGCGDAGGHSEAMVFLVVKGSQDLYTLQWAERGAPQAKPIEPDAATWRPRAETLGLSLLCDPVPGETAPYPSCSG